MYHSKLKMFAAFALSTFLLTSTAHAATATKAPETLRVRQVRKPASDDPAATTNTVTAPVKPKPRANRILSRVELGVSYAIWNERFSVNKGGTPTDGIAGYGGYVVNFENTWIRHRWQWGGGAISDSESAKPSANLTTVLPEGRDRPWYTVQLAPYVNYRVSMNGQLGLGVMARYRNVSWVALDQTTQINVSQDIQIAPLLDIRWSFGKWSFIQTFAMLDSVGDSLWMWTLQRAF